MARIRCLFFIMAAVQLCYLYAQPTNPHAEAANSLQRFFQALVKNYTPSTLPKFEELLKVTDRIPGARPEDIFQALPSIFVALAHPDDNVKLYAAGALLDIGRRQDSAELLKRHINAIANLVNSPNERLRGITPLILGNLRPAPPPEIWPLLLSYVTRTDLDPRTQASAFYFLVSHSPENPEVLECIKRFLSQPLDTDTRISILHVLGNPRVKDVHLMEMMIAALEDPNETVRLNAIHALSGKGQSVLIRAEPALHKLIERADEPAEVKDAAKKALKEISPRKE
ncbi:MAG: HEAT repeat domain-containing protein [Nitrospirales bacterium]